ncbi:MAG: AtpZ/AtpI family protein [Bacteroidota bacterium]
MAGNSPFGPYLKYTTLGLEMLACVLVGAGGGYMLDQKFETEKPWFVLGLSLFGCATAIYLMVKTMGGNKQ